MSQRQSNQLDQLGRLAIRQQGPYALTHHYDELGQLDSVDNYVDDFEWTANGQLKSITYANGVTSSFDYDPERQWMNTAQVRGPTNQLYYQAGYQYDAKARVTNLNSTTDPILNASYHYDALDRLMQVDGDPKQQRLYAYDALGNMTYNSAVTGNYAYANQSHVHAVSRAGEEYCNYDKNRQSHSNSKATAWQWRRLWKKLGSTGSVPVG